VHAESLGVICAAMEDVLEVYQRPYTEKQPAVCLDETSRQLTGETGTPPPVQPGHPAVCGYEYVRSGTAGLFMLFEPHAGRREVRVNETRTKIDFAHCLREPAETRYPEAEKIVLVMDNLNTHTLSSLYEAFPAEQARNPRKRFEVHHTPRHAGWLNMAEIETGVMSRQCLARRIPTLEMIKHEAAAWVRNRNAARKTVH
jgi:hypothetical protein